MRRAFTLLELLTIVAIIAIMVSASLVSVQQGQAGARIRGATRDIFATIRHARSMALVSQQPSVITYSTEKDGDDVVARVEIVTAKMFTDSQVKTAFTLEGEEVRLVDEEEGELSGGQTVEDVLFSPIASEVVRGVRIKVIREGEELDGTGAVRERPSTKISVFSTSDYLLQKLGKKRADEKSAAQKENASALDSPPSGSAKEDQEPVSIVWEANGRTEPHRVWIYPDGSEPESGLSIKIDKFGAAKVLGKGEEEE